MTIVTDKAHSYGKVIGEWRARLDPYDAIRHVTRKHLNNRIEGDHAVLKHSLRPMRGLQGPSFAKAALKGIETFRAIRRGDFVRCDTGVMNEIRFVRNLFDDPQRAV
ncbi:DDE-type integrase/transposase/recombinase [Ponticoccus alexandrii]|uniref:DDE-type integrase/transposase/recombinase n=1 Tax=Ponticoccus alexandrii TaxID=1943633 RepID=A0ABX7F8I9_9RHOB|nr:DDE-type integrase/transposase/recombinase [Ponticoccus alexandrii]QRF66587.1 DDE-type integrase/transposase/recombinase [Ponticoccus alexandrii]